MIGNVGADDEGARAEQGGVRRTIGGDRKQTGEG